MKWWSKLLIYFAVAFSAFLVGVTLSGAFVESSVSIAGRPLESMSPQEASAAAQSNGRVEVYNYFVIGGQRVYKAEGYWLMLVVVFGPPIGAVLIASWLISRRNRRAR